LETQFSTQTYQISADISALCPETKFKVLTNEGLFLLPVAVSSLARFWGPIVLQHAEFHQNWTIQTKWLSFFAFLCFILVVVSLNFNTDI